MHSILKSNFLMLILLNFAENSLHAHVQTQGLNSKKSRNEQEWEGIVQVSKHAQDVDPELWNAFCKMKQDLGITEEVPLLIVPENYEIRGDSQFYAMYSNFAHAILLKSNYRYGSNCRLIFTLAHELEHHRQNLHYPGSYHGHNGVKQEHGADAAAAGYLECSECLKENSTYFRDRKYNEFLDVEEKILNKIFRSEGYFGLKAFEPYLNRAEENQIFCKAHQPNASIYTKVRLQNYLPE